MKYIFLLLVTFLFSFSSKLHSQNFLFAPGSSGFHLAPAYSFSNTFGQSSKFWATNLGFTLKGRLTGSLAYGNQKDNHDISINGQFRYTSTKILGSELSFLLVKQEQHRSLMSFSFDAAYQFNRSSIKDFILNLKSNILSLGFSIYRNFHFSKTISISPSFSIGKKYNRFQNNVYIRQENSNFIYQNYQLTFKISKFFLSPAYQIIDKNKFGIFMAGFILPIKSSKNSSNAQG